MDRWKQHAELVSAGAGAAGAIGTALPKSVGNGKKQAVASSVAVKIVDPLEMIEVEQEQDARRLPFQHLRQRAHQLAAVCEACSRIRVRIALGNLFGGLIGVERVLEVLRTAPAEQNDRDVEEEGDLERARRIYGRNARDGRRNELAADDDE